MTMTSTTFSPATRGGRIRSWLGAALSTVMLAALSVFPNEAHAMKVQEVKSPGGIEAWLVESNTVPLIAMRFAFEGGGSTQDPSGKEGVAKPARSPRSTGSSGGPTTSGS
jgi:zinc protease